MESEAILTAWDAYSDEHSDADGLPLDEVSYGWRMVQRDAETWRAFQPVRSCARELLNMAAFQFQHVSAGDVAPHWSPHLRELRHALDRLEALRGEHAKVREARRAAAPLPQEEVVDSLAERNEEAWSHLDTWAVKGRVLFDIHATALKTPPRPGHAAPAPARPASPLRPGMCR
ncbi:hypothetical protein [Streptomyces sp. NPDC058872]|uniref:hypothetical protein n=1 Tax=Streptomyces sp. NPDC058872 TaxID=3346661 RepID=UPI0036B9ED06